MKDVLLFGSFDILHPGHDYLIHSSQKYGKLTVSLAHDKTIEKIKGQEPVHNVKKRIKNLQEKYPNITVIKGDKEIGSWSALKKYQPEIIVVGYDQNILKTALTEIQPHHNFTIIQLGAFVPEQYKSSLLRKKL